DGDAELSQLVRVHVAARASAEEDDVLQPLALLRHLGRQRRMIDDADLGAVEHGRPILRLDVRIEVDLDRDVVRLALPLEDIGQRVGGVDENCAHGKSLRYQPATPASDSTVCIRTLVPAAPSAWGSSSRSF